MNNRKFSTVLAAIVIAFLSIYAAASTQFQTTNNTSNAINVTLQLQSGGHPVVGIAPNASVPTTLSGDAVTGITVFGSSVPAGMNVIISNPSGGSVSISWQMNGGQPAGAIIDPFELG